MRQSGTFKIKRITGYQGDRTLAVGCRKSLSLRAQISLHWDSLENGIRQQSKAQSAPIMNCEVLGNKSPVRKVMVLLKDHGWGWTIPCLAHQEKMATLTLWTPKPHLLLILWGWKSNLPIRIALMCSGPVSSPVSFSVMDANDIFLSNFSSLDTNSVSDLGGELREFGAGETATGIETKFWDILEGVWCRSASALCCGLHTGCQFPSRCIGGSYVLFPAPYDEWDYPQVVLVLNHHFSLRLHILSWSLFFLSEDRHKYFSVFWLLLMVRPYLRCSW